MIKPELLRKIRTADPKYPPRAPWAKMRWGEGDTAGEMESYDPEVAVAGHAGHTHFET